MWSNRCHWETKREFPVSFSYLEPKHFASFQNGNNRKLLMLNEYIEKCFKSAMDKGRKLKVRHDTWGYNFKIKQEMTEPELTNHDVRGRMQIQDVPEMNQRKGSSVYRSSFSETTICFFCVMIRSVRNQRCKRKKSPCHASVQVETTVDIVLHLLLSPRWPPQTYSMSLNLENILHLSTQMQIYQLIPTRTMTDRWTHTHTHAQI